MKFFLFILTFSLLASPPLPNNNSKPDSKLKEKKIEYKLCKKSNIQKIMKRNINRITYCYDRELLKTPKFSGKVVVSFNIVKTGKVVSTRIDDKMSIKNKNFNKCIKKMIDRIKFPAQKGSCQVKYPFFFKLNL